MLFVEKLLETGRERGRKGDGRTEKTKNGDGGAEGGMEWSEEEVKKKVENAKRESLCRDIVCFSYFVK